MVDSLRDQLLKNGIKAPAREEIRKSHAPRTVSTPARPMQRIKPKDTRRQDTNPKDASEMDLARAYALRAQTEAAERKRVEQATAEQARLKRERKTRIAELLRGKGLNKVDGEHPRHFEYGGKIRRVYLDAGQLCALNAGELGLVQDGGRYALVSRDVAEQVAVIDAKRVALLVDPSAAAEADDGVPDDLMW